MRRAILERNSFPSSHAMVVTRLISDPTKLVNLADPDVAEPVQKLIDSAESLARRDRQT